MNYLKPIGAKVLIIKDFDSFKSKNLKWSKKQLKEIVSMLKKEYKRESLKTKRS